MAEDIVNAGLSRDGNAVDEPPGKIESAWAAPAKISSERTARIEIRIQLEKGRLENSSGNRDAAKPYFRKAIAELQQDDWFVKNEAARLANLIARAGAL